MSYLRIILELCWLNWNLGNIEVKENDLMIISCLSEGLIQVQSARYGLGSCWGYVTNILRGRCNSRTMCIITAENSIFSDPCEGDVKVLQVEYVCGKFDFFFVFCLWNCFSQLISIKWKQEIFYKIVI